MIFVLGTGAFCEINDRSGQQHSFSQKAMFVECTRLTFSRVRMTKDEMNLLKLGPQAVDWRLVVAGH